MEILIALSIFSIMAVMSTSVLYTVFNTRDRTTVHSKRINQIQVAFVLIKRDFLQLFIPPKGMNNLIQFTRGGNINPLSLYKQSSLTDIEYHLTDQSLVRVNRSYLGNLKKSAAHSEVLLENVTRIQFEYIDKNYQRQDLWQSKEFPIAIRMTLSIKDIGQISELYLLPQSIYYEEQIKSKR